jgi:hypothetical protein
VSTRRTEKPVTLEAVIYGGNKVAVQTHPNGCRVIIRRLKKTGQRVALFYPREKFGCFSSTILPGLTPSYALPVDLLGLCSGRRDGWLSRVSFKCAQCGTRHEAREMEGEICQDCGIVDEESAAKAAQVAIAQMTAEELDREHAALVKAKADRHARMAAERDAALEARRQAAKEEA